MVILVLLPQFEMADVFSVINQYGRFIQIIPERGVIKDPVEDRLAIYLFFQELYITGMQDIIVDAPDDLLLVNKVRRAVAMPVDRVEQVVLRNIYFKKLLDV